MGFLMFVTSIILIIVFNLLTTISIIKLVMVWIFFLKRKDLFPIVIGQKYPKQGIMMLSSPMVYPQHLLLGHILLWFIELSLRSILVVSKPLMALNIVSSPERTGITPTRWVLWYVGSQVPEVTPVLAPLFWLLSLFFHNFSRLYKLFYKWGNVSCIQENLGVVRMNSGLK